ncbi:DEAD/DEAH box helicase [Enhygromyxa salina]|uniref:DEAD/DEAH box helicase n=1 Tax=Enhygromyxa salina TaxID=215803 RepID=A0A2S9YWT2_9BACT|nr:DEAD/DEAH box helicase family protein [Enhygromyxa salina]PRQ09547.1 DEAD/DEAH box helicase [Enhygromyxa salina]
MTIQRDYEQYLARLSSAKFRKLFLHQAAVLKDYSANFADKKDVAVELPTGAGKTPIALLIAGAWLEEGKKVAVLSANKTLARQMANEARELGISFAHMEGRGQDLPAKDRRAYQRAQAIGIMNYWVYFNQSPVIDPADLLVMDDAHLAEHCLHSLYSVEITKFKHERLFTSLVEELQVRFPDYGVLRDALSDDAPPSSTAELMSFIDQDAAADRIRELLDSYTTPKGADLDLKFRWQRLRPKLRDVNLYVSRHALWLRPYVYPLVSNPHYANVSQALYMSATVGDAGDLARRLGTRPIEKISVDPKHGETTSGRRLIVMNRTSDEGGIPKRMAAALLEALRLLNLPQFDGHLRKKETGGQAPCHARNAGHLHRNRRPRPSRSASGQASRSLRWLEISTFLRARSGTG